MKRFLISLLGVMLAISVSATCRDNILSRLGHKSDNTTTQSRQPKADVVYESINKSFTSGRISADSVVNLALYHKAGNPEVAERCLRLVADDNNPRAMTELGVLYTFSPAFSHNTRQGLDLLQKAVQAGYKEAAGYLGYYYFTQKDYDKARTYLEMARPLTLGIEYATLGSMYLQGKGVKEDGAKARENFKSSALLGLPRGMALYASLLGTKNGGPIDYPDSFFWYYIAGELGDNYSRVMLYRPRLPESQPDTEIGKDARLALTWIEAVHAGKSMKNEPLYKEGFLKGLKEREKAAEHGDDRARFYLGGMNYNGDFLNQNFPQALRYYEAIAANNDLPEDMLAVVHQRLSEMYRDGKGMKADASKATFHSRLAAKYGSKEAYKIISSY